MALPSSTCAFHLSPRWLLQFWPSSFSQWKGEKGQESSRRILLVARHTSLLISHWPEFGHMATFCKGSWEVESLAEWPCAAKTIITEGKKGIGDNQKSTIFLGYLKLNINKSKLITFLAPPFHNCAFSNPQHDKWCTIYPTTPISLSH